MLVTKLYTKKVGPKLWELQKPMFIHINNKLYSVPPMFYTDGASNIRFLWGFCPPMSGETAECAVFHDWLYSLDCPLIITRLEADNLFLKSMELNGVGYARRIAVYQAVRMFGAMSFRKLHSVQKCSTKNLY